MLIREFAEGNSNVKKLAALTDFLEGRAQDQNAKKEISKAAFFNAAKSLGINISEQTLSELIAQEPLKNILEPIEPNSDVIRYKGNKEVDTAMSVDQSQQIVDKNAKAAMRRGMKN
jgi:hypothetical protein